jgi:glutamate--cysteine ligase
MPPISPRNPKNELAKAIVDHHEKIDAWFLKKFSESQAPFYCSIDIRDSGEKVAPVDCNLYPAGFNNICEIDLEQAVVIFKDQIAKIAGQSAPPSKIGIIPENHTENKFYLENLYHLRSIIEEAGFEVEIIRIDGIPEKLSLTTASEKTIVQHPARVENGKLRTDSGFTPDWLILNHDYSAGYPKILDEISQPVLPSHRMGWHSRKKSTHFKFYNELAAEFAKLVEIDPWLISIESEAVGPVNFNDGLGVDRVVETAGRMLKSIEDQYRLHSVDRKPALFIKNDSGTYGMGIMVIHSVDELISMNRRTKNKMSTGKGKTQIEQVLVQEGIPTQMVTEGSTSEPVIYLMNGRLIGGFIRANTERDEMDNLNSQGMFFKKLCFKDLSDCIETKEFEELPLLEAVYGVIGRLSALAAAREIRQTLAP